jgi:hypothetical protein
MLASVIPHNTGSAPPALACTAQPIAQIGGRPPSELLRAIGIEPVEKRGEV